jgi:hypothetical protein
MISRHRQVLKITFSQGRRKSLEGERQHASGLYIGLMLTCGSEIQDDSYLHAFRIFRDKDSGGVRFEATPRRGPMRTIPIWTAFVTQYIGNRTWMKRVGSSTVQFRELHPYMFCEGYRVPKGNSGRYQLTFTTPQGLYLLHIRRHIADGHRRKILHGSFPSNQDEMTEINKRYSMTTYARLPFT